VAIANVKSLVESETLYGRRRSFHFVKNVTQATTAGIWFDLSGSAGNPRAKQWFDATPLAAAPIAQSTDGGIFHGGNVTPDAKYLRFLRVACASATPLPMSLYLCDYLMYYPTIDDGVTDPQMMDNTQTLPRYTTGAGVQMMAVTISSRTGGASFTVSYTNQDGTAGRTTTAALQNSIATLGTITTSATATDGATSGPFLALQDNDTGVRSVQSVTMLTPDTGLFALVLVRPLAGIMIRGNDAPYDKDFLLLESTLPQIQDDAFLSLLCCPNGSLSGIAVRGTLDCIWG
jgi:hypothetical protein